MSKPLLCLDFDGVIHGYQSGWQGAAVIPDPPVPGAIAFIVAALEHFRVAIYSSRSGEPGGIDAMKAWLGRAIMDGINEKTIYDHRTAHAIVNRIEWPTSKPPAFLTLDDRALTFTGWWPKPEQLLDFKTWQQDGTQRPLRAMAPPPETVDHPAHYNSHPSGVECIDVVRHLTFNLGNAFKYLYRRDHKGAASENLRKAAWYIDDEITRWSDFGSPHPSKYPSGFQRNVRAIERAEKDARYGAMFTVIAMSGFGQEMKALPAMRMAHGFLLKEADRLDAGGA